MPSGIVTASMAMTGVALALLVVYAADVAVAMSAGTDHGFLPLDHMQRGMGLGGPSLILPIAAFFISRKEPSRALGAMIIITGIMIVAGGVAVLANPSPSAAEAASDRNPVVSAVMLFAPAAIQIALGGIKIAKS